jgi:hypothetical protein
MLIDCPHCQARVNGEVRKLDAHYESEPGDDCPTAGYREALRACLLEAHKCLHANAYTACVAMSGRAIEAMCRHFGTKRETLA